MYSARKVVGTAGIATFIVLGGVAAASAAPMPGTDAGSITRVEPASHDRQDKPGNRHDWEDRRRDPRPDRPHDGPRLGEPGLGNYFPGLTGSS